jgi:hypothetical protein
MGRLSAKLRSIGDGIGFWCPGCDSIHVVRTKRDGASWKWDGNVDAPTISPSILVTYDGKDAGQERPGGDRAPPARCHSLVKSGRIEFLADCTHALAGRIVPIPDWPYAEGEYGGV